MHTMMMNRFSSIGIGSFGVLAVELLSELGVTRVPKLEVKVNYSLCVCCHQTSSALYPVEGDCELARTVQAAEGNWSWRLDPVRLEFPNRTGDAPGRLSPEKRCDSAA